MSRKELIQNLILKTRDMREVQKAFFRKKGNRQQLMLDAKQLEKEVDDLLEEVLNPKTHEQKSMF